MLTVQWQRPCGETPAARHFDDLCMRLAACAEHRLLPEVTAKLEAAVAGGQIASFARHRWCAVLRERPEGSGVCVLLQVSLSQISPRTGEEILFFRELVTHWNGEGTIQYPRGRKTAKRSSKGKAKRRT